jgi:hypothetical protein
MRRSIAILLDNQVRPTSARAAVNDAARIFASWIDCSELLGTSRRPAVFTQERSKVCPCSALMPGVPQSSGPAALRLVVGAGARVDDHSDGVSAFL